ncbi:MAG TPA: two-component system response regulator [Firmicutes bacterium]|nr:two-component system response regulator [Bacillota bacterium]HBK59196.1 two-component system response regulator [Bacillota bacterium]
MDAQLALKVLLVEDDPMVLEIHDTIVSGVPGFTVVGHARDGRTALEMIPKLKPDIIILDVYMPGRDGMDVFKEIRSLDTPVDVIMVTAAEDSSTVVTSRRLGAFDYIIKPFRFERLRASLESYRDAHYSRSRGRFCQDDIDRAWHMRKSQPAEEAELPKGIQSPTLDTLSEYLRQRAADELSTEQIASELGISRMTVSRYLEFLVDSGSVTARLDYSTGGRPRSLYRWTGV